MCLWAGVPSSSELDQPTACGECSGGGVERSGCLGVSRLMINRAVEVQAGFNFFSLFTLPLECCALNRGVAEVREKKLWARDRVRLEEDPKSPAMGETVQTALSNKLPERNGREALVGDEHQPSLVVLHHQVARMKEPEGGGRGGAEDRTAAGGPDSHTHDTPPHTLNSQSAESDDAGRERRRKRQRREKE